ncbi:MAG: 16S rRNA (guanine(527)-N(7))-methyltransferase RsmG [Firmicutes bacterium]|nr:16S rRNA (guanine(527)-N(7))-methyltransferase RsmG [Bacillota bacterium]
MREAWDRLLLREAAGQGIGLSDDQIRALAIFRAELLRWNEKVNLTSVTDEREMAVKHFLDSLYCLKAIPAGCRSIVDVGSGAGFPGIPLAVALPGVRVTLIEATGKKTDFLRRVVDGMGLGAAVLWARAETAGRHPDLRERFDVVVARAVAELRVLAELCLPLCAVGGRWIAMKGPGAGGELASARRAICLVGGGEAELLPYELPFGLGRRNLVVVGKEASTPERYPRRVGVPERKPL